MAGTAFTVRRYLIPPQSEHAYIEANWRDALVVVESGAIELEAMNRLRRTFVRGDVLTLARMPLRVLRNRNPEAAVLVATYRTNRRALAAEVRPRPRGGGL